MATTGSEASLSSTGQLAQTVGPNTKLTYAQIEGLWIQQGGDRTLAPLMAAIAMAESGGKPFEINDDAGTGDYSVGLWQINYYDGLYAERAAKFGPPEQLRRDPAAQARAANSLLHSQGLSAWTTYTRGTYRQFLQGNVPPDTSSVWGTGATSGNGATTVGLTGANPDCLIPLPSVGSAIGVGGAGQCLLTREQGRQLLGGLVMLGGGAVMAFGVLLLFAIAFRRKGRQAIQVVTGISPQGAFRRGFTQLTTRQAAAGAGGRAAGAASRPRPPAPAGAAPGPLLEPIPTTGANPPPGPARRLPKVSRSTRESAARLRREGPTVRQGSRS